MGQSKKRGTFEQRKTKAIKRDTKILRQIKLTRITKEQNLSPEEKTSRNRTEMLIGTLCGVALAGGMPSFQTFDEPRLQITKPKRKETE